MARSDLLLSLVKSGASGDQVLFRRTVEAMIAEERGKRHDVLAERLSDLLQHAGPAIPKLNGSLNGFAKANDSWIERVPRREFNDLILPESVEKDCREMIEEHNRADLLRSHNLMPRNRVLLVGDPGNGKTSLAEGIAFTLAIPFVVARYEGLIGSYLGETASRLKKLFDFARSRACILFFDEFDTVGKERGDTQETGEIKRVVSSLLLQIDDLPSYTIVVAATNHPELLDRAVWRRFQLRLELPRPSPSQAEEFFRRAEARTNLTLGIPAKSLAEKLDGASYAELEEFLADVFRQYILGLPDSNMKKLVNRRLAKWQVRYTPGK